MNYLIKYKEKIKNYVLIILAAIILAFGVVGFLSPNKLLTGGTAGLALLLYYITPLTIGTLIVLVNVPLIILGGKVLGKLFVIRTIFTIVAISIFIDFFDKVLNINPFIQDTILAAIFGGIFIGIGLSLVIKADSSAGGSTIIAKIVAYKSEIKPATVILIIDAIIILSSLFIFEDRVNILWSVISIYITAKIVDKILTGRLDKKVVHLVTDKTDEMKMKIREELGPKGTIIQGDGLFDKEHKKIILLVVDVNKLQKLRQLVKENDSEAFIVISEASEFLGRGY